MIVLDEQLLGRNIEKDLEKWYAGKVIYINELRPNTVIKDDAIPSLLRDQKKPVFISIKEIEIRVETLLNNTSFKKPTTGT